MNNKKIQLNKELEQLKQRFPDADYSFIDLYLSKDNSTPVANPSLRSTFYLSYFTSGLPDRVVQDFHSLSTERNRSVPITPLRTAWEMGRKWSKMMGYGDLKSGQGGANCCEYEWGIDSWPDDPDYPYKGRVQVLGLDGEHYDTVCNNATGTNMAKIFRETGHRDPSISECTFSLGDLPAGMMSYRGWAGCNGWEDFRHTYTNWTNISNAYACSTDPSDWVPGEAFIDGHFYVMFSNVCDTGDFFPVNEEAEHVNQCSNTCLSMNMAFVNAESCNQGGMPGDRRASIAWIGPSDLDTDTRYNNSVQNAWFDSLILHGYREVGELLTKAKGDLFWIFPNITQECTFAECSVATTHIDYFYSQVYTGHFEPSLPIWTGKPGKMKVAPVDDVITESPWGRWKRRPRYLANPDFLSDEVPLDIGGDEPISFCVYNELNTPLEGINVSVVYQHQPPWPYDQVYKSGENPNGENGRMGRKNYVSYLLRSEFTDEAGCVTMEEIQLAINHLEEEAMEQVGDLQAGRYIQVFLNSESRRTIPLDPSDQYEQRVITYRLQG